MKFVTVFFDLEGKYGCPFTISEFHFKLALQNTLKILDEHEVKGTFNTCGKLANDLPALIKDIHNRGHEIASHGYAHENFLSRSPEELIGILRKTESVIQNVIGEKPIGVRAPGLSMNLCSSKKMKLKKTFYSILEKMGYRWASNYCVWPVFKMPHKILTETFLLKFSYQLYPFRIRTKKGLPLEIPLLSPLESSLLGLPRPITSETAKSQLDVAFKVLRSCFDKSGMYFNLNFHPWVIGSGNRLALLEQIVNHLQSQDIKYILARDLVKISSRDANPLKRKMRIND